MRTIAEAIKLELTEELERRFFSNEIGVLQFEYEMQKKLGWSGKVASETADRILAHRNRGISYEKIRRG
jgi:hypothetical protein